MTLEQLFARRRQLEGQILELFQNFEKETGVEISDMRYEYVPVIRMVGNNEPRMITGVQIGVKLPSGGAK